MTKIFLRPISYSITYSETDMIDYIEECDMDGIAPTQEGFQEHVQNMFNVMLEEYAKPSNFERTISPEMYVNTLNSAS